VRRCGHGAPSPRCRPRIRQQTAGQCPNGVFRAWDWQVTTTV
jgi:hypothetical protein